WMRSFEPSMTFTCTFRVSPGRKSGTSLRSDLTSTKSRVFIFILLEFARTEDPGGTHVHDRFMLRIRGCSRARKTHPAQPEHCARSAGRGENRPHLRALEELPRIDRPLPAHGGADPARSPAHTPSPSPASPGGPAFSCSPASGRSAIHGKWCRCGEGGAGTTVRLSSASAAERTCSTSGLPATR